MKKIKHCPFCDGRAKIRRVNDGYAVRCEKCHATGHRTFVGDRYTTPAMAQSVAIESWNTRAAKS